MAAAPSGSSARARSAGGKRSTSRTGPNGRPAPPTRATLERRCRRRWRPTSRSGPVCGYSLDGKVCRSRGAHYCAPRADRFVKFCAELLVHTAGPFARRAFVLEPWQEWEIARPLFGEVVWSAEWQRYVRRYSVAYIIIARKNGKSALAAAIVLYLLVGDDEESAEVYGAAADTKQAGKVYQPVRRMMQLSPVLAGRLGENKALRRIFDEPSNSYYEVIPAADALGELGHNPHGFVLDEVLSQPDSSLWEALRTAAGARAQPLFLAITTETNDPASFGAALIDEAERIQADPARAPHVFRWSRRTPQTADELAELRRLFRGRADLPVSVDPWDERNWWWANPALGTFKSLDEMRRQALEARNDPSAENGFRQYQLNQRVQQVTRWLSLARWDATAGIVDEADLEGRSCFAGLDIASTTDLAAWVLLFPPDDDSGPYRVLWRFWVPEAQIPALDQATAGAASTWVRDGLLAAGEGDWIDYEGDPVTGRSHHSLRGPAKLAIHPQIAEDARRYRILSVGYDPAQATATAQHMQSLGLDIVPIYQGFGLSPALQELARLVRSGRLEHGGHPVARWNADSVEIRTDDRERIRVVKPDRRRSSKRIDGIPAAANALRAEQLYEAPEPMAAPMLH